MTRAFRIIAVALAGLALAGVAAPAYAAIADGNGITMEQGKASLYDGTIALHPSWAAPASQYPLVNFYTSSTLQTGSDGTGIIGLNLTPKFTVPMISVGTGVFWGGKLKRVGAPNSTLADIVYATSAVQYGVEATSVANAVCIGGAQAGNQCTVNGDCDSGNCDGGSPLYPDAFYNYGTATQLRNVGRQKQWVPIGFLDTYAMGAKASCSGGSNDDTICTKDSMCKVCVGGSSQGQECTGDGNCPGSTCNLNGQCVAGKLYQRAWYGGYVRPSMVEQARTCKGGASAGNACTGDGDCPSSTCLYPRFQLDGYDGFVVDDIGTLTGTPEIGYYAGFTCDPNSAGWPDAGTTGATRWCVRSRHANIKSFFVGGIRIGDETVPTDKLEINGDLAFDKGSGTSGTIYGSRNSNGSLTLNATTSATGSAPEIRVNSNLTTVSGVSTWLKMGAATTTFDNGLSSISALKMDGTILSAANDAAGFQGAIFQWFAPTIRSSPTDTNRTTGSWYTTYAAPIFQVDNDTATLPPTFTVNLWRPIANVPQLSRKTPGNNGSIVVTESTGLFDRPVINTGGTITTRRGVWMQAPGGSGAQTNVIGLDVDDQTATTLVAGLRSTVTSGSGKWTLLSTGTAASQHYGVVNVGGGTAAGEIRILEPSGGGTSYASLVAPALAANTAYTLPVDDGEAGELLMTNGSGTLSWEPRGDGVVADLPAAACVGGTGYTFWDLPATAPATTACVGTDGTNTYARGVLAFPDGSTLNAKTSIMLPSVWSGALYADIYWGASNTSAANVVWQITGACSGDTETHDPTLSSTANTVTDAVLTSTANFTNKATITLSNATNNPLSGCVAGEQFLMRLFRDPTGSDTSTATANLYRVVLRQS